MTIPRWCERCGRKPEAYHQRRWCYDCKPTYRSRPPKRCRRCGTTDDYWSAGLCRRCHQYAPQRPESCPDCLAWGTRRIHKWLCGACQGWRVRYPAQADCISCGEHRSVNDHHACRLCWRQAKALQPYLSNRRGPLDIIGDNRHGQQLELANMASPKKGHRPHKRTRPTGPPTEAVPRRHELPGQLALFSRDRIAEAARTYAVPDPPNAWPATELDAAIRDHARRHGWPAETTRVTRIAMRVLLGTQAITAPPIQASQVRQLRAHRLRARPVLAVLNELGMLHDDRTAAIDAWFTQRLDGLPTTMAGELQTWYDVMRHGSTAPPRSRPRTPGTVKARAHWALPTMHAWAAQGHQSLREITRQHILAILPASGTPRATLGAALRSIFTTLKAHKVTFINPMARISVGNFTRRIPMLLELDKLRDALNSPNPAGAALAALVIFHGLRPDELRDLTLTDVRDARLHLADRVVPIADPVKQRLAAYLADRQRRWPNTANPHFFIHHHSAHHTAAVQRYWVNRHLGIPARALRQHRIVDEVQATAGDLRRICDFFGVTIGTAQHYATTLNHPALTDGTTGSHTTSSPTQGLR